MRFSFENNTYRIYFQYVTRENPDMMSFVLGHAPRYIRGVRCVIAPDVRDAEPLAEAYSYCNPVDLFDKETGRRLSLLRAIDLAIGALGGSFTQGPNGEREYAWFTPATFTPGVREFNRFDWREFRKAACEAYFNRPRLKNKVVQNG